MNVSDTEAVQHEQTVAEANLTPEQRAQARDILHSVTDDSADLIRAQECAWRIEELQSPQSAMSKYCQLMRSFSLAERREVVHGVILTAAKEVDLLHAITLRVKLLSYAKSRRGSPWR